MRGNFPGALVMTLTMFAGVLASGVSKELSFTFPVFFILALRFILVAPAMFLLGYSTLSGKLFKINVLKYMVLRILLGNLAISLWFFSLKFLTFSQATALGQTSALFATIAAPWLLGESVGVYRWTAVIFGLIGIICVTEVNIANFGFPIFIGLGVGIIGGALKIVLRILGKTEHPLSVAFWHNSFGAILYPLIYFFTLDDSVPYAALHVSEIISLFCLLGIAAFCLQLGLVYAFKMAEVSVLATIQYSSIPLSCALGYLIWQEGMTLVQLVGIIMVLSSGIIITLREYRLSKK